jgi:hypothetical protein
LEVWKEWKEGACMKGQVPFHSYLSNLQPGKLHPLQVEGGKCIYIEGVEGEASMSGRRLFEKAFKGPNDSFSFILDVLKKLLKE